MARKVKPMTLKEQLTAADQQINELEAALDEQENMNAKLEARVEELEAALRAAEPYRTIAEALAPSPVALRHALHSVDPSYTLRSYM